MALWLVSGPRRSVAYAASRSRRAVGVGLLKRACRQVVVSDTAAVIVRRGLITCCARGLDSYPRDPEHEGAGDKGSRGLLLGRPR